MESENLKVLSWICYRNQKHSLTLTKPCSEITISIQFAIHIYENTETTTLIASALKDRREHFYEAFCLSTNFSLVQSPGTVNELLLYWDLGPTLWAVVAVEVEIGGVGLGGFGHQIDFVIQERSVYWIVTATRSGGLARACVLARPRGLGSGNIKWLLSCFASFWQAEAGRESWVFMTGVPGRTILLRQDLLTQCHPFPPPPPIVHMANAVSAVNIRLTCQTV